MMERTAMAALSEELNQVKMANEILKEEKETLQMLQKTLQREIKYWEVQAKTIEVRRLALVTELKLCMGTAP